MSTLTMFSTERNKPTTDWDDAQRRIGNLPPLEPSPDEQAAAADDDAPAFSNAVAAAAADADADELARLRDARLNDIKAGVGRGQFGTVSPLTRDDYVAEVNQAGEGIGVIVFLHKPRHYLSAYTLTLLEKLARKFANAKFLQIDAEECIPNYPEANLPTLLLYKDDDMVGQCVGAAAFGGSSYGIDDIEWELAQAGIVTTDLPKNPHQQRTR